jgi:hypothetical protein
MLADCVKVSFTSIKIYDKFDHVEDVKFSKQFSANMDPFNRWWHLHNENLLPVFQRSILIPSPSPWSGDSEDLC